MNTKIVGRVSAQNKLNDIINSKKAEFVAVYGRRRVGKTFLIKAFFKEDFCFYATGLAKGNAEMQLINFALFLNDAFKTSYETFPDWLRAFRALITELKKVNGKKIIFIDELPWMDTKKSDFLAGLEFFWNAWASTKPDIKLIVCGSAASWMINKLIKNKGGLHHRLTNKIKIEPFTLQETEALLISNDIHLDRYQIVQLYMALGGIPYYLEQVQKGLSAAQNIQALCFNKDALLRKEFSFIFSSLFANGAVYENILNTLNALGSYANREAIIAKGNFANGGGITTKLKELEENGFIAVHEEFGQRSAKKQYFISDFYTLFYFKFIVNSDKEELDDWLNKINENKILAWQGLSFEQVCLAHKAEIKNALKIMGINSKITTWQKRGNENEKGAQIDLVIDRNDRTINLCEIKFSINPYVITKDCDLNLRNKVAQFKAHHQLRKSIFLTFISTYGLVANEYSRSIVTNEITMNDLFIEV